MTDVCNCDDDLCPEQFNTDDETEGRRPDMSGQRIEKVYAYLMTDDDGAEGIPVMRIGGLPTPLMAADEDRLEEIRPHAERFVRRYGSPLRLVLFTNREEKGAITQ